MNKAQFDAGDLVLYLETACHGGFRGWLKTMKAVHPDLTTPAILGSMKAQLSGDPDMARAIREAAAD